MGEIHLELTVANLQDMARNREVSFLVDTGATRSWVPKEIADDLGIESAGTVPLELADGTVKELAYGYCFLDFGGELITANIIIDPEGSEPLVGTHVLQEYRMVVDMDRHTISRSRAMRAK